MTVAPYSANYGPAVRATFVWAGLTSLIVTTLTLPFVLAGPAFLFRSLSQPVSVGKVVGGLIASFLGGLLLYGVLRCTARCAARVRRSPGYPDRHWSFVRRAFRWFLWTESVLLTAGACVTVFAIYGHGWLAEQAFLVAGLMHAVFVFLLLTMVLNMNGVLRHTTVALSFPRNALNLHTFGSGKSLARHVGELDEVAGSLGLASLSSFGLDNALVCVPLPWHDPAEGLKTVNALLIHLQGEEIAWDDHAGLVDDLKRLAHTLTQAEALDVPFSLQLLHN